MGDGFGDNPCNANLLLLTVAISPKTGQRYNDFRVLRCDIAVVF